MKRLVLLFAFSALAVAGSTSARSAEILPIPGMLCSDGSDPIVTGIACGPVILRNAIDEGRASSVLPRQTPAIQVPNDPLGRGIGNSRLDLGTRFGNPAIQLPEID